MMIKYKNMMHVILCTTITLACSTKEKETPLQVYHRMDYQDELIAQANLTKYYSDYKNKLEERGITQISCAVLLDNNKEKIPRGKHCCRIYGKRGIEITGNVPFKLWGGVEIKTEPFSVSCSYNQTLSSDPDYKEEFRKELDWTLQYYDKEVK